MKRLFFAMMVGLMLTLVFSATAGAHDLVVTNPQTGDGVNEVWVGGFPVPADAPPMFGPFNLPPSHGKGMVNACHATADNATVTFLAPPHGSCEHGVPLSP